MPEEINRVTTDRVSDFLLAPSEDAADNLRSEGYRDDQIHLVGNVMVDTLLANVERARRRNTLERFGAKPSHYGLVTLHRPANVDDDDVFGRLVSALNGIAAETPLVFPVHPRTRHRLARLDVHPEIQVTEPLGYLDFLCLQANSALVLTDSGGIQEETTVLGVPCLTLRENTERPITITEGTNRLVGRDPQRILSEARRILQDGVEPRRPALWDGHAGDRIADVLLTPPDRPRLRPTEVARAS
jgi:UDP-N-acetylglucosamine 2-epimerase (non-hydrolysing)